jgi:hypothetical protein
MWRQHTIRHKFCADFPLPVTYQSPEFVTISFLKTYTESRTRMTAKFPFYSQFWKAHFQMSTYFSRCAATDGWDTRRPSYICSDDHFIMLSCIRYWVVSILTMLFSLFEYRSRILSISVIARPSLAALCSRTNYEPQQIMQVWDVSDETTLLHESHRKNSLKFSH